MRRSPRRPRRLDAVAEELLFVTGPLLVGLLVGVAAPATGLVVSAVLVLTGTLALVSSPAARAWHAPRAGSAPAPAAAEPAGAGPDGARATLAPADVPDRHGVRRTVAAAAGVGVVLGALDLLVLAAADARNAPAVVPWVLAAVSAGSALGGLGYGAVAWRAPARTRLSLLGAALGLTLAATGLCAPHPALLVAWAAVAGVFVAPALTTAYLLADESAGPGTRTKAGAWVNTAYNAGSTAATAATGLLVGPLTLPVCFVLAAVPALCGAWTAATTAPAPVRLRGRKPHRRRGEGGSAEVRQTAGAG
ncbi:MFS transporter [Streptomyces sp. WAC06614]|uniref:MFS transporter n=1 Tax=Streptomyces sp. WAC06614 TaxID=2487416 RepID=UPI000F779F09|nr:MFS transporter [Streptomyces sp. WAC06614]RSS82291.1 hypothetical protein EF918_07610 [Streptomyces sp. WAC06614]